MDTNPSQSFNYKDLLLMKIYYAVLVSITSQLVILFIYVFFANINLLHPWQWLALTLNTFTFVSTWFFVIIFIAIISAQCIICAKDYVLATYYCTSRFQKIFHIYSLHNFILLILHVFIGAIFIWHFMSLVDGEYQSNSCKESDICLVEKTFFLTLNGIWIGLYYFLKKYISSKRLTFPVIQQSKLLQFRNDIFSIFKNSLISAFWPTIYFSVIYYFFGSQLRIEFENIFGYTIGGSTNKMILFPYSWWCATLYFFNMNLMRYFFQLFLTEPVEFPLVKQMNNFTLQEALLLDNLPIIQKLACLDLFLLSRSNPSRRQIFFTLSEPGHHPYNWNALVENVVKLITQYTELLNKSIEYKKIVKSVTNDKQSESASKIIQSPVMNQEYISPVKYPNLRNMSAYNNELEDYTVIQTSENVNWLELKAKLKKKFDDSMNFLKMISGINYFFGELPEANLVKCLENGQIIIWASQGISQLISASLEEDKFGIVQKDLPLIISSLIQLKQCLDKLDKVPILSKRLAIHDSFNYKMNRAVTAAVKRSLFNICKNFGNHLSYVPLKSDVMLYLQSNFLFHND